MRLRAHWRAVALASALALSTVACGGGSDDGESAAEAEEAGSEDDGPSEDDQDEEGGEELSGEIAGAGASSQAAAKEAWIAGFQQANPGTTVTYDPIGTGGGREQFVAGGTLFGGTDAALEGEQLEAAIERCGEFIEMPVYISPIAIVYNLEGVDELNLPPDVIAGIFNQDITSWDDEAIAEANPDAELPDTRITPVNRSDESGTTENFQDYLATVAEDVWDYEVDGNWPVEGGEAAQGTSGVVAAVGEGVGTIGYADASQVGDLGVVNVGVGDEFVGPTPEAAAAIVEASERIGEDQGEYIFAYDLARDTEESGTYPIVLISYEMACTEYDDENDAAIVQAFMDYIISEEGQQTAAEAAGSAPLSDTLREQLQPAVDAIGGG